MTAGWQWCAAIKHADIIESKKSTLEDVHAIGIFAIDPPGEIQKQFLKNSLEKNFVPDAAPFLLNLVDAPRGPRMHRWVHVAEGPLVSGQLSVGMHVPFAQHQHELFFCELRIDQGQRHAMKRQVPRGVPWI